MVENCGSCCPLGDVFLSAMYHLIRGRQIRRKCWREKVRLVLAKNGCMCVTEDDNYGFDKKSTVAEVLYLKDMAADDWEVYNG